MFAVRDYLPTDEQGWLRCRLLSFFRTNYYDDIVLHRKTFDHPAIRLVAESDQTITGLIDIEIFGETATIDCIAVHPDHQRAGLGTALLSEATRRIPASVRTLDAWTREDAGANAWYRSRGFGEQQRYLHVYKDWDDPDDGFRAPTGLKGPLKAFLHGNIEDEARLRQTYKRVYVCRQYLQHL